MPANDKSEFNENLEILKVNIMSDYYLGVFIVKFGALLAAAVAVWILWYQVSFPTLSNNPATYLNIWYYLGGLAIAIVTFTMIVIVCARPYKNERTRLDESIERIRRRETLGSLEKHLKSKDAKDYPFFR